MKKTLFVVAFIASIMSMNAQKNVIKANPLGLAFGIADLSYERVISDNGAVEVGVTYFGTTVSSGFESVDASAIGGNLKYKFYFSSSKEAPRGWYAAPAVGFSTSSTESSTGTDLGFSTFSGAALAGYQWVFGGGDSGFSLDLFFGVQYLSVSAKDESSSVGIEGVLPALGLSLGYAF